MTGPAIDDPERRRTTIARLERAGALAALGAWGSAMGETALGDPRAEPGPALFALSLVQLASGFALARTRRPWTALPLVAAMPLTLFFGVAASIHTLDELRQAIPHVGPVLATAAAAVTLFTVRSTRGLDLSRAPSEIFGAIERTRVRIAGGVAMLTGALTILVGYEPSRIGFALSFHSRVGMSSWAMVVGLVLLAAGALMTLARRGRAIGAVLAVATTPLVSFMVGQARLSGARELGVAPLLVLSWITAIALVRGLPASWRPSPPIAPVVMAEHRRRARQLRNALVVALVPVGLLVVGLRLWANRPFTSEEDQGEVRRRVDTLLVAARDHQCARPVLRGEPLRGDATDALADLLDDESPYAACFALGRGPEISAVLFWDELPEAGRLHEMPAAGAEPSDVPDDPPPPEGDAWGYLRQARPFHRVRLPVESRILETCEGLAEEIERIAQHESVCTPAPFATVRFDDRADVRRLLAFGHVVSVLARERMRVGATRNGFELLLTALRLTDDARRGHPHLVYVAAADAASQFLVGQASGLAMQELPFADGDLDELVRQATVLAATQTDVWRPFVDDLLASSLGPLARAGWHPPRGVEDVQIPALGPLERLTRVDPDDVLLANALTLHRRYAALCEGMTSAVCRAALDAEQARLEPPSPTRRELAETFPQLARDTIVDALYAQGLALSLPVVRRYWQGQALSRALAAVFVHRRLGEPCPDATTVEAALAAENLGGGPFTVLPSGLPYRPLEVCAPAWLAPPGAGRVRLALLDLYCPRFATDEVPFELLTPAADADAGPADASERAP